MGLFGKLFKPATPGAPPPKPVQYPPVPSSLPKIKAPTAAQIAPHSNPSPAAQQILAANPKQTPAQYLSSLQQHQMGDEMVKTLAHGLPDRDGVHWAAQSAAKVSDKLPPPEVKAMNAAQAWAKSPTPENQAAAAMAAEQGGCRGPGSMAAQAAAWANPAPGQPRLAPHAVTGAVLMAPAVQTNPALAAPALAAPSVQPPALAAPALPAPSAPPAAPEIPPVVPPEIQAMKFEQQHPFIKMGLDIASGQGGPA
jgi:hypothetical protein